MHIKCFICSFVMFRKKEIENRHKKVRSIQLRQTNKTASYAAKRTEPTSELSRRRILGSGNSGTVKRLVAS